MARTLFQHLARAVAEMLMQRDPYPEYIQPKITGTRRDECGHMVIEVRAGNYRDVERVAGGANFPGRTVHVHTGKNKWEVRQENNQ